MRNPFWNLTGLDLVLNQAHVRVVNGSCCCQDHALPVDSVGPDAMSVALEEIGHLASKRFWPPGNPARKKVPGLGTL